jgi:hypothetical protein
MLNTKARNGSQIKGTSLHAPRANTANGRESAHGRSARKASGEPPAPATMVFDHVASSSACGSGAPTAMDAEDGAHQQSWERSRPLDAVSQKTLFKESLLRDYIVQNILNKRLSVSEGRKLLCDIISAQLLKILSQKDFTFVDGKLVDITPLSQRPTTSGHGESKAVSKSVHHSLRIDALFVPTIC